VQSKFLAVGALVPWAEAEAGAVATQAHANVRFGPAALALLRDGVPAEEVVARLTETDGGRDHRQFGVVDAKGCGATYTGGACLEWAGGLAGAGFAAQGNLLVSGETVDALAQRFVETAHRPLAERLLAALEAGQSAGGDRRGQQSAALLVARKGGGYDGWDVAVDLRVDDHPEPITELIRLYGLHDLYFGETPAGEWLPVDAELAAELRERLARLGHASGDLEHDLEAWAGIENLEERVAGAERIDPVVLRELRARGPSAVSGQP